LRAPAEALKREASDRMMREIVAPVALEPTASLVSKSHFEYRDLTDTIRNVPWFQTCGEGLKIRLSMPVEGVSSWPAAVKAIKRRDTGDARLEAHNQLTEWLDRHAKEDFQKWNSITAKLKARIIEPFVSKPIKLFIEQHHLPIDVLHSVRWDILAALMENHYLPKGHTNLFFLELLTIYQEGHYPCGWVGDWPRGTLLVY